MKAAVLRQFNRPLSLESVPVPKINDSDVLVKIRATGICHSDLHLCHGHGADKLPVIPGHECAGVVERVGTLVKNVQPGDRVLCDYLITCGNCHYCTSGRTNLCVSAKALGWNIDGAYAEYVALPSSHVFQLPGRVSFDEGAIMGCAVVTAYHATSVSELRSTDSAAIIGMGAVGYHILKLALAMGLKRVIVVDVDERKLARAKKLGAETVNSSRDPLEESIRKMTDGEGVDVGFEAIGLRSTVESTIRSVGRGGRVALVGMCFDKIEITPWYDITVKEIKVVSPLDHLRTEIPKVIELVSERKIDLADSITHRLSLDEANRGLEMLERKIDDPVRIVMVQ